MANTATLATMRVRAQRRSDLVNSAFIPDAEWNDYLNEGGAELHDLIVTKFQNYIVTSATTALVGGTDTYALPTTFFKAVGMDYESGTTRYRLDRFMFSERNLYRGTTLHNGLAAAGGPYFQYSLEGDNFRLIPIPASSGTVRLWYVPQYTQLAADGTAVAVYVVNGWEEMHVLTAAIKALSKLERDTSQLEREKQTLISRIVAASSARDAGEPMRVTDTTLQDRCY